MKLSIKWLKAINEIFKSKLIKLGFLLSILHAATGLLGYVYQVAMGRFMTPEEFGLFTSIMALSMFLGAPLAAITMVLVRKISGIVARNNLSDVRYLFRSINKTFIFLSTVLILVFVLLIDWIQVYLKSPGKIPIIMFGVYLVLSLFFGIMQAFFQGLQWFYWLGIAGIIAVVSKIILSSSFVLLGYGVNGAIGGIILSSLIVFCSGLYALNKYLPSDNRISKIAITSRVIKNFIPILVASVSVLAMTQLDMVLVNWYFSPLDSGIYAAASVLGKAVLYIPGGFILVFFPLAAENHIKKSSSINMLSQALIATFILCGTLAMLYWFFGSWIIDFLYGKNYQGAGELLKWYGLALLPIALVMIAEQFLIAQGQILFSWVFLIILPIQLFAIYNWHSELWMIITIMGVCGSVLLLVGFIWMIKFIKNNN